MKKILFLAVFIILAFSAAQCALSDPINNNDEQAIFDKINSYRIQHGLHALKMNEQISQEAQEHSHEMAENIIPFGHDGFDVRVHRLFKIFDHTHGIAENVAYTDADVKGVVQQWLQSSGHRSNIEGNYSLTGIGIAYDKNGRAYVTQIFLRN